MIGRDFPVVAVIPPGEARLSLTTLVEGLGEREAELMVIGEDANVVETAAAGFVLPGSCTEKLSPMLYALPAQLLAHDLSLLKGFDPDAPRGLSKVTETW